MFRELLVARWAPFGALSEEQLDALENHYRLLMRWNQKMNLTRIVDLEDIVCLHYCEGLFLGSILPPGPQSIVDVGSGAGFPGVPIAVLRPECRVVLVESNVRKAVFLRESCRGLRNISVVSQRVEDLSGSYDWLVSRAVLSTTVLSLELAPSAAILMSSLDLEILPRPFRVIPVPWGEHRIIATFHVEH